MHSKRKSVTAVSPLFSAGYAGESDGRPNEYGPLGCRVRSGMESGPSSA